MTRRKHLLARILLYIVVSVGFWTMVGGAWRLVNFIGMALCFGGLGLWQWMDAGGQRVEREEEPQ